jgi:hypothetical protein
MRSGAVGDGVVITHGVVGAAGGDEGTDREFWLHAARLATTRFACNRAIVHMDTGPRYTAGLQRHLCAVYVRARDVPDA